MSEREAELQMLDVQARSVAEQLERVDSSIMEVEYLKNALDEMKSIKADTEILAPMSGGVFVRAKIQNTGTLLVNVGKDVVVEKTIDQTKELLDDRTKEMNDIREKLLQQMQKIEDRLISLGEE